MNVKIEVTDMTNSDNGVEVRHIEPGQYFTRLGGLFLKLGDGSVVDVAAGRTIAYAADALCQLVERVDVKFWTR